MPSSAASSASERPGLRRHEPEQRRLPCRDAELLRLLPQLAREPKEHRAELGGDLLVTKRNLANH